MSRKLIGLSVLILIIVSILIVRSLPYHRSVTVKEAEQALVSVPSDPKLDGRIVHDGSKCLPLLFKAFDLQNPENGAVWYNAVRLVRLMQKRSGFDTSYIRKVLVDETAGQYDRKLAARMCYWLWDDQQVQAIMKEIVRKGDTGKGYEDPPMYIGEAQVVAYAHGYPPGGKAPRDVYMDSSGAQASACYNGDQSIKGDIGWVRGHPNQMGELLLWEAMRNLTQQFQSVDPAQAYIRSILADWNQPAEVRIAAVTGLSFTYGNYKVVEDALIKAASEDPSAEVRAKAVSALSPYYRYRFVPDATDRMADSVEAALRVFQKDSSANVRAKCLEALTGLISSTRFATVHSDLLLRCVPMAEAATKQHGESADVKQAARDLLAQARTMTDVLASVKVGGTAVSESVLQRALTEHSNGPDSYWLESTGPSVLPAIFDFLRKHNDQAMRVKAIEIVGDMRDLSYPYYIVHVATDPTDKMRTTAVTMLQNYLYRGEIVELLQDMLLNDPSPEVRASCISLVTSPELFHQPDTALSSKRVLIRATTDKSPVVREALAKHIGDRSVYDIYETGQEPAWCRGVLLSLMHDPEFRVRRAAADGVARIDSGLRELHARKNVTYPQPAPGGFRNPPGL